MMAGTIFTPQYQHGGSALLESFQDVDGIHPPSTGNTDYA
jgi:hypothetical protein